ncbi:MAG: ShlB/FhaC/HecB family hemolysin secretion/activation protein [Verrucomicrobiota bacterium]
MRAEEGGEAGGGAVLLDSLSEVLLDSWEGGEPVSLGDGVLASSELKVPASGELVATISAWLDRPLTEGDLVALADAILRHFDREGFPVLLVDVPEQDFAEGRLRFLVEIGRIGRVAVGRPRYGEADALRDGLWLESGALLDRRDLDEQFAWYGRSVFRNPKLFVSPGEEPATADLLIGLEERKPWQVTVGYANNGPETLGRDRFSIGAVGMTRNEHLIGWQTVLGAPASSLQSHALHWEIPIHHLHQTFILDAGYAEVSSLALARSAPRTFNVVQNDGTSWSLSAAQRFILRSPPGWNQSITAGVELKSTDQFALFGAFRLAPGEVRLLQAKASYDIGRTWENGSLAFNASLVASPGGLISGNDDADFQAYDPQADSNYHIARIGGLGWWSPGGDWRFLLRATAQWADSRLLPVEQFAVGGESTLRGASERQFFADNGWQASFEAYTPAWSPVDRCQLRFLGFVDHGWLKNRGRDSSTLTSTGIGVRMFLTERLDLRADHGWRLDDDQNQSHVALTLTF